MEKSRSIVSGAGIIPKLRLGNKTDKGVESTGPHRVKFLADKEVKGTDHTGKEIDMVAYLVEENGQKKSYRVPKFGKDGDVHYLVQRFAEVKEGEEVILHMKRKGAKNYVEVIPVNDSGVEVSDHELDIPVINEEDQPIITDKDIEEAGLS